MNYTTAQPVSRAHIGAGVIGEAKHDLRCRFSRYGQVLRAYTLVGHLNVGNYVPVGDNAGPGRLTNIDQL